VLRLACFTHRLRTAVLQYRRDASQPSGQCFSAHWLRSATCGSSGETGLPSRNIRGSGTGPMQWLC